MATRTYQIQLELTNGQTQIAGNFTVSDGVDGKNGTNGKNGESITDLEVEPAGSTDDGNIYNVYYKVGEGERQAAGSIIAPRGEQGKAGTNGSNGAKGADGRPVYSKISGSAFTDRGLTDYLISLSNLFPTSPTPVVNDTVIFSTDNNTYIGSVKQVQSSGILVTAKASLKGEGSSTGGNLYRHLIELDVWPETVENSRQCNLLFEVYNYKSTRYTRDEIFNLIYNLEYVLVTVSYHDSGDLFLNGTLSAYEDFGGIFKYTLSYMTVNGILKAETFNLQADNAHITFHSDSLYKIEQ